MELRRTFEHKPLDGFREGDVVSFTLTSGEDVEALAVQEEQDGITFILMRCLRTLYHMNNRESNWGGYKRSDLRKWLNETALNKYPGTIRKMMMAFENGDLLRLPTEKEIFGCNLYGKSESRDTEQWPLMVDDANRVARIENSLYREDNLYRLWNNWYWLQTKAHGHKDGFVAVSAAGTAILRGAKLAGGIRPVFKLRNW